jgi:hypothetical protein
MNTTILESIYCEGMLLLMLLLTNCIIINGIIDDSDSDSDATEPQALEEIQGCYCCYSIVILIILII